MSPFSVVIYIPYQMWLRCKSFQWEMCCAPDEWVFDGAVQSPKQYEHTSNTEN